MTNEEIGTLVGCFDTRNWSLVSSLVTVVAPSRLHFGLYGFGQQAARQFGGVGAMIEAPCIHLTARRAPSFSAVGPLSDRVREFAQRWATFYHSTGGGSDSSPELPRAVIETIQAPPEHSGLGVGTQLGLSVAAALNALHDMPSVTPTELAQSVGRAQRSAVGTYGFVHGGLIAERGKLAGEAVSPLDARVPLPVEWRFVLVRPRTTTGLAGLAEVQAFEQLPPVPQATTDELVRLAREELFPAAAQGNFALFTAALDRYCDLAGHCFAPVQGGAYNGPMLAQLAARMQECGGAGVGQSSWGPTLFSLFPSETAAEEFITRLQRNYDGPGFETWITPPNNTGAAVHRE